MVGVQGKPTFGVALSVYTHMCIYMHMIVGGSLWGRSSAVRSRPGVGGTVYGTYVHGECGSGSPGPIPGGFPSPTGGGD
jgi:hypothetical protein